MRAFAVASSALFLAAVACTTTPDDPIVTGGDGAFFTRGGGSFDKLTVTPTDGAGLLQSGSALPAEVAAAGVRSRFVAYVADRQNVCTGGPRRADAIVLSIDARSGAEAFAPGTYTGSATVGPGQVELAIAKLGTSCASDPEYRAESGTVTITTVRPTYVAGTFDVTLRDGAGTLSGSFNVPLCPSLDLVRCSP